MALRNGKYDRVILVMRGWMKVKPFDVSLEWMGKYHNFMKAVFWQDPAPSSRLSALRSARSGGSITPPYVKILKEYEAAGRLEVKLHTELENAVWHSQEKGWTVVLNMRTPEGGRERSPLDKVSQRSTEHVDYIIAATGASLDVQKLRFLASTDLIKAYPPVLSPAMPQCQDASSDPFPGGFPYLTEDLQQWNHDVPLFFVGAFSAMQVGPAAFNLGGMREAAERVVERLQEIDVGTFGVRGRSFNRNHFQSEAVDS